MLTFGAGTLPAMLGLTLAAPALSAFLSDRLVRRIVGFSLVVLAAWMFLTLVAGHGGGQHH
jgi:sulfite exporter TauE/SafE